MKTFIDSFKKSFVDKAWYKEIFEGRVRFSFGYIVILALISSIVVAIFFTVFMYRNLIPNTKGALLEVVPGDLILTFKSNELSINKPVPYTLPLPENSGMRQAKKNLLVIDTSAIATLESTKKYDTVFFASKDSIITEKDNGEITAQSLKNFPDMTVTREKIIDLFEMIVEKAWLISIFVLIFSVIAHVFQMLITFLIAGTLLWIVLKIASRAVSWKTAYVAVVYAYTIIFTANLILTVAHIPAFRFTHGITITTIIAAVFAFMTIEKQSSAPQNTVV